MSLTKKLVRLGIRLAELEEACELAIHYLECYCGVNGELPDEARELHETLTDALRDEPENRPLTAEEARQMFEAIDNAKGE